MADPASKALAQSLLGQIRSGRGPADAARSYLPCGHAMHVHYPSATTVVALDVEKRTAVVPPFLARDVAASDAQAFWSRWTAWEVVAKLADVPVVILLDQRRLTSTPSLDGVAIATGLVGPVVASVGVTTRPAWSLRRALRAVA